MVYIGFGLILFLMLTGAPLAVAFGVGASVVALFVMGIPLECLAQFFFSAINSYPLIACPFFVLAGHLILKSGGMEPLRDFMGAVLGHLPGGLAISTIVFATFLGSISGSSAACLAIIGIIVVPILVDYGYDRPFASGIAVTSGELGLLIPPSLFFILLGALCQISIADLFLAGIGPGVLSAFLMCCVAVIIAKRRKYPVMKPAPWRIRWATFIRSLPMLFMPVVVLGSIYSGICSPTQAAAVSVLYSVIVGVLCYRKLSFENFMTSLVETVKISSMIYMLVIGGDLMGRMLAYIELPQKITLWVASISMGPTTFLLMVEALLLLMGFVFSSIPMIIIVLPLFLPSVVSLGIDPVFYGVLAIMVSLIGEVTPPMGPQLWFAAPICNEKMGAIARESWIFLIMMAIAVLIVTFVPGISMFLVDLMR